MTIGQALSKDWITVELTISNIYPDGTVTTHVKELVPRPSGYSEDVVTDWATDNLFEYTGAGRDDVDSGYEVTITASDDQHLVGSVFEFGM